MKGLPWRQNGILKLIANEKYMGDAMMGKSVRIDGQKRDNLDGSIGEQYYIENAHEGIVSKETYYQAQAVRQQRANPKLIHRPPEQYAFTDRIECGCCHKSYRHKVNHSGEKWSNDFWICATHERYGKATCGNTRIKDSVLREKFIEAYNEFVTLRPQGTAIEAIQTEIQSLRSQEQELATLLMRKLLTEKDFRDEQQRIKNAIREKQEKIQCLQRGKIKEKDFKIITEFDASKVPLFLQRVIIQDYHVTFRFYNGVEITKEYTNGQPGNKPGWNKKEA